jgi:hypothetical protein
MADATFATARPNLTPQTSCRGSCPPNSTAASKRNKHKHSSSSSRSHRAKFLERTEYISSETSLSLPPLKVPESFELTTGSDEESTTESSDDDGPLARKKGKGKAESDEDIFLRKLQELIGMKINHKGNKEASRRRSRKPSRLMAEKAPLENEEKNELNVSDTIFLFLCDDI